MSSTSSPGWVIGASSFTFVVVQLDVTIVNVALPAIGANLGSGIAGLQWVVDAYTLAFAVLLLSAGTLGDLFGSRRVFVTGFAVFAAGSLACGLAPEALSLIAGRAVQGVGAALMVPTSLAVLNHATAHDAKLRARAVGVWTAAGGIAIGTGPVLGGLLLTGFGWRSIFLVNLPVCAIGAALTLICAPSSPKRPNKGTLDIPGQILVIIALAALIGGVIEMRPRGIGDPVVVGALLLFASATAAFIAVERRSASPMLPLRFFADPAFNASIGFGVAVNLAYYGILFVLTLYLQTARGWSPLGAGLALLPLTATFIVSNLVSGWMIGRYGSRRPMVVGGAIGSVGYALMVLLDAHTPFIAMLPIFMLVPAGMGLGVPAMTTAVLASADPAWAGTNAAVLNAARQAAVAIGVAAFGALAAGSHVILGLHVSAAVASAMLMLSAILSWRFIARVQVSSFRE